ncbi:MAG TPA: hypothetical protein VF518_13680, partial [Polyangia bacterium]
TYYVTSTLNWKDRGLALTQTTDLPLTNKVSFAITAAPTDAVSLKFRKPYWASTCQVGITVNGQAVTPVEASGFLSVSQVWKAGDKVELTFPLFVQVSRLQDNQNAVAFTYGPLVLSAGLGTASMTTAAQGVQVLQATKPTGLQETITINSGTTINAWVSSIQNNMVQTTGKLEFNLKNTDSDGKLVFIPHYSRYADRYGIYWKLGGTAGGTATTTVVCPTGTGGAGGSGGTTGGTGGSTGSGGTTGATGGATSAGGVIAGTGGTTGAGGTTARTGGATTNTGGATGAGGAIAPSGGTTARSSGSTGGGGNSQASGGTVGGGAPAGGATGGPGGNANGGSVAVGNGGTSGSHATGGSTQGTGTVGGQTNGGCSCNLGSTASTGHWTIGLLLGLGLLARRRNRRR